MKVWFYSAALASTLILQGCIGAQQPLNDEILDPVLVSKADDGSRKILAKRYASQQDGKAILGTVEVFMTERGLYAAHWDQWNGAFATTYRARFDEIESVRTAAPEGLSFGKMLMVVKKNDGTETSFTHNPEGDASFLNMLKLKISR